MLAWLNLRASVGISGLFLRCRNRADYGMILSIAAGLDLFVAVDGKVETRIVDVKTGECNHEIANSASDIYGWTVDLC